MFDKSRKKIALLILAATILFLMVTLAAIYITSYLSLKNQSREMLNRYINAFSLDNDFSPEALEMMPESPPQENIQSHPDDGVLDQMSSFYSVAYSENQDILAVDSGWGNLHTEEEILELARDILGQDKQQGTFCNMLYSIEEKNGFTLVAFMDNLLMETSIKKVMLSTLIVGLCAVLVFSLLSHLLARQIIRPLEENDRRQKQFVSDAGHELKTPISVINTNAEILSRQIGANQWLSNIQYENDRMGNLVLELLTLSRAESGTVTSEDIDLSRLVQQEVLPFETVAFEKGLEIHSNISDGIVVKGNRSQLSQLVAIFVDNAISYSNAGAHISVTLKKGRRQAELAVENPAEKIPEDVQKRLFDRFFRVDEARGGSEGHFGLGLSIAKAITDKHRGKINVEFKEGRIIFSIMLPI